MRGQPCRRNFTQLSLQHMQTTRQGGWSRQRYAQTGSAHSGRRHSRCRQRMSLWCVQMYRLPRRTARQSASRVVARCEAGDCGGVQHCGGVARVALQPMTEVLLLGAVARASYAADIARVVHVESNVATGLGWWWCTGGAGGVAHDYGMPLWHCQTPPIGWNL